MLLKITTGPSSYQDILKLHVHFSAISESFGDTALVYEMSLPSITAQNTGYECTNYPKFEEKMENTQPVLGYENIAPDFDMKNPINTFENSGSRINANYPVPPEMQSRDFSSYIKEKSRYSSSFGPFTGYSYGQGVPSSTPSYNDVNESRNMQKQSETHLLDINSYRGDCSRHISGSSNSSGYSSASSASGIASSPSIYSHTIVPNTKYPIQRQVEQITQNAFTNGHSSGHSSVSIAPRSPPPYDYGNSLNSNSCKEPLPLNGNLLQQPMKQIGENQQSGERSRHSSNSSRYSSTSDTTWSPPTYSESVTGNDHISAQSKPQQISSVSNSRALLMGPKASSNYVGWNQGGSIINSPPPYKDAVTNSNCNNFNDTRHFMQSPNVGNTCYVSSMEYGVLNPYNGFGHGANGMASGQTIPNTGTQQPMLNTGLGTSGPYLGYDNGINRWSGNTAPTYKVSKCCAEGGDGMDNRKFDKAGTNMGSGQITPDTQFLHPTMPTPTREFVNFDGNFRSGNPTNMGPRNCGPTKGCRDKVPECCMPHGNVPNMAFRNEFPNCCIKYGNSVGNMSLEYRRPDTQSGNRSVPYNRNFGVSNPTHYAQSFEFPNAASNVAEKGSGTLHYARRNRKMLKRTLWTPLEEQELQKIFMKCFQEKRPPSQSEREAGIKMSKENGGWIHFKSPKKIYEKVARMLYKDKETAEGRALRWNIYNSLPIKPDTSKSRRIAIIFIHVIYH